SAVSAFWRSGVESVLAPLEPAELLACTREPNPGGQGELELNFNLRQESQIFHSRRIGEGLFRARRALRIRESCERKTPKRSAREARSGA
ncbi:unnamed protein product, partial [Effrenium voratum]